MIKHRYLILSIVACLVVCLSSCGSQPPAGNSVTQTTSDMTHTGKGKININNAILSELDKLEGKLGVPALSNKIQASRPYGSTADLVSKKVITQEQFEQIKNLVTVEEVVLTGEAKDIDYMTKLALMKGHLLVAEELLKENQPKQAQPHIGHPVEEIYVDIEEQLNERKVKQFKEDLVKLTELVRFRPQDKKVATNLTVAMSDIDTAITALPNEQRLQPKFILQVIRGLLDAATAEYQAAIAKNKITAPIEYQDSRGFVIYSHELYQSVSPQMATVNPEAQKAIDIALTELLQVWPSAIPPNQIVKTPEQVNSLVKTIEENAKFFTVM
ncbi:ComEA family DNA-binding protein [Cylindrospermopsis raciborskii]|uniref:DNA uptake protein n=1 Tax=Cylindrospermopsis raciborskii CENA302 TaxID=1170768 RepID=A0A9Q5QZ05_9CYAN|nr:helix-hairpin-helix domain-containing protein [Cylindrospermopsis raciborskii]NLQ06474.1 helix-hairpin-helix domain-containing protein [Cylindrospermopsis raciborskii MVCC19]OHY32131.1 DNA uptake protein [Cylindrospermopsis raciborskii MVCC14]OPH10729.1 DNA uptake protein [Cylindrospermopsis raciborskii CENA302]